MGVVSETVKFCFFTFHLREQYWISKCSDEHNFCVLMGLPVTDPSLL
jgi:hypothetical protein